MGGGVENTHDAIISKDMISESTGHDREPPAGKQRRHDTDIFSGLVKCADWWLATRFMGK